MSSLLKVSQDTLLKSTANYTRLIPERAEKYLDTEDRIRTHLELGDTVDNLVSARCKESKLSKTVIPVLGGLSFFLFFLLGFIWGTLFLVTSILVGTHLSLKEREQAYEDIIPTVWHLHLDELEREPNLDTMES